MTTRASTCAALAAAGFLMAVSDARQAHAVVIGNWESGTPEGWIDWSGGQNPIAAPFYAFNAVGATNGTGAVQYTVTAPATYRQWLALKLQQGSNGVAEYRPDFFANRYLTMDLTLVPSEFGAAPNHDFAYINLTVNAPTWGFANVPAAAGSTFNPLLLTGTETRTLIWDYSAATAVIPANADYVELIFETYANGPVTFHVDNVQLLSVIPEPASLGLLAAPAVALLRRRRA